MWSTMVDETKPRRRSEQIYVVGDLDIGPRGSLLRDADGTLPY